MAHVVTGQLSTIKIKEPINKHKVVDEFMCVLTAAMDMMMIVQNIVNVPNEKQ
jgi:hypothetical protein